VTNYYALIAAAGESRRFGDCMPKQYYPFKKQTILEASMQALLAFEPLQKLVVVLHPKDQHWQDLPCAAHPKIATTPGGDSRTHSVLNGLHYLASFIEPNDFVLVHDAARPFLTLKDVHQLVEATKNHPTGGILATPVVDTLKRSTNGQQIEQTIARDHLYRALTPQCFRFEKLFHALKNAPETITDEAMAIELAGHASLLVMGDPKNNKITYLEELS